MDKLESLRVALKSTYGLHVSIAGLTTVHAECGRHVAGGIQVVSSGDHKSGDSSTAVMSAKQVWDHVLNRTLKGIAESSLLTEDSKNAPEFKLPGLLCVQVIASRNISQASDHLGKGGERTVGMQVSDGFVRVHAMETETCRGLPDEILPGAKVIFKNAVMKYGVIWMTPNNVVSVSGGVASLANVYKMKKGAHAARSFYDTLEQGEEPPPPFVPFTKPSAGSNDEFELKLYLKYKAKAEEHQKQLRLNPPSVDPDLKPGSFRGGRGGRGRGGGRGGGAAGKEKEEDEDGEDGGEGEDGDDYGEGESVDDNDYDDAADKKHATGSDAKDSPSLTVASPAAAAKSSARDMEDVPTLAIRQSLAAAASKGGSTSIFNNNSSAPTPVVATTAPAASQPAKARAAPPGFAAASTPTPTAAPTSSTPAASAPPPTARRAPPGFASSHAHVSIAIEPQPVAAAAAPASAIPELSFAGAGGNSDVLNNIMAQLAATTAQLSLATMNLTLSPHAAIQSPQQQPIVAAISLAAPATAAAGPAPVGEPVQVVELQRVVPVELSRVPANYSTDNSGGGGGGYRGGGGRGRGNGNGNGNGGSGGRGRGGRGNRGSGGGGGRGRGRGRGGSEF